LANMAGMQKLYIGALNLELHLLQKQLEQFQAYYQELVDWNKRINLTAITDCEDVQIYHFLDALTVVLAWQQIDDRTKLRIIDVGTGGGIPGIPIKIMFPEIGLVLLEATRKKADFLSHVVSKLGITDTEIVTGRAEEIARVSNYREQFDIVLSRAVAPLAVLAELTLPFCVSGGEVIAYKKGDIVQEVQLAEKAIELLGGRLREIKPVTIPELTDDRKLVIIEKVSPTPDKYPRRPGMPSKRPL